MPQENLIEAVRETIQASVSTLPQSFLDVIPAGSTYQPNADRLPAIVVSDRGETAHRYSSNPGDRPQIVEHEFEIKVYAVETDASASNVRTYLKAIMQALTTDSLEMTGVATPHLIRTSGSNRVGCQGELEQVGAIVYTGEIHYLARYHPPY